MLLFTHISCHVMLKPSLVCRTCWKTFDSCLNVLCCNCIFKYKFGQLYAWQLYEQLDEEAILHWKVDKCKDSDGEVKIELYDGVHGIARYTVAINTALEFSIYVFHWPIADNHAIHLF